MHGALITKLPDSTIQKIAAGEVITKPFNVVKELLENSIDAGATNIKIFIDQGGLRLIEIIDNGHGMARENAELLCQRYTTSKLSSVDDLSRISTFGFRGEALASISEMADVEVRSHNTSVEDLGWQASYKHGILQAPLVERKMQSSGTHIRVTNLFDTIQPRKTALMSSFLDEKKSIIDLVTRYAIHHRKTITMSLKENSSSPIDLVCSLAPAAIKPCIGNFFGVDMEEKLIELSIKNTEYYRADAYIVFSHKKSASNVHHLNFILFVNNRLVECDELKKEINAIAHEFLGAKQIRSLIYIALNVPPCDIDVNTHPAKASVTLHYQQEIIALILTELRSKFVTSLGSQTIVSKPPTQKTIGELVKSSQSSQTSSQKLNLSPNSERRLKIIAPGCFSQDQSPSSLTSTPAKRPHDLVHNDSAQLNLSQLRIPPNRIRRDLKLRSITELRKQVVSECSKDNSHIIKKSVFVGIFDHDRALIQNDTKLYAINLKAYLIEQVYQFYLFDIGNFPPIEILPPGNKIKYIIETYLDDLLKHEPKKYEKLVIKKPDKIIDKLLEHIDMFKDYLSLNLTTYEVLTIPNVIPNHIPNLLYLGKFLVDLANHVDYSEERKCLHKIGRIIAEFYSEPPANLKDNNVHRRYHQLVESRLFESVKRYLMPPEWLFTKENICQITDTKDLYKVFERC